MKGVVGEGNHGKEEKRLQADSDGYRQQASPIQRFLASRSAMFMMAGVAGVLGLFAGMLILKKLLIGVVLAVVGVGGVFALHTLALGPMILKQALGTNDPRQLD